MLTYSHVFVAGTRIIYDRAFLMQLRNSPLTKSPPPNLPKIPGVTSPLAADAAKDEPRENGHEKEASGMGGKANYLISNSKIVS